MSRNVRDLFQARLHHFGGVLVSRTGVDSDGVIAGHV